MDVPALAVCGCGFFVDRISEDVEYSAEGVLADRNVYRASGIDGGRTSYKSVGAAHGDTADDIVADVLCHLHDQSLAVIVYLKGVEQPRKLTLAETVMNSAIPDYLTAVICAEIRKSFLSELYARRNAMDSATKNASEMIDRLNLSYNRARQSSITQEITEIVAGAENQ